MRPPQQRRDSHDDQWARAKSKEQLDAWLDAALDATFPASDPVALPPLATAHEGTDDAQAERSPHMAPPHR